MRSFAARSGRRRLFAAVVTALTFALTTVPALATEPPSELASEAPPAPSVDPSVVLDGTAGPKTAILPLVVVGELPDTDREALSKQLVEGLERGSFEVVTPEEVLASAGDGDCAKPRCMTKIAGLTHASHIVRMTVEVIDRDYQVSVELYDGSDGSTLVTTSDGCEICGVADVGELIQTQAATLRTKLDALASGPASIVVRSTPNDATVTLDGELFGTTPIDKPILPGEHVIRVSKEGYIAVQEKRTFVEGTRENLDYELEKVASRLPKRPWGWATLGVGLVSLTGSVVVAAVLHKQGQYTLNGSCPDPDEAGQCPLLWDTLPISLPAGIVGGALTTLGVAILLTTAKNPRKKAKLDAAAARIRVDGGGIGFAF